MSLTSEPCKANCPKN